MKSSKALLLAAVTLAATASTALAATYTRTNTGTNLSGDTTAWNPATVPGSGDIAAWDSTGALAGASNIVNAAISWDGIQVTNITGALTIGNANTNDLTIGASGIDLSAASANVTINNKLVLGANQNWQIANGRTFTALSASRTGSGTGNVNITNSTGSGTATVVFNANGNNANWNGYSGGVTVNSHVKVQSQGNATASFGSGIITLAGGEIAQNAGNWTWGNTIDFTAASVIASDSSNTITGRTLKLLGNLTSSNGSGVTFTMRNNTTVNDANGFILAGATASTYGTTTISANTKVRVGGEATTSLTGTGFNAGTRGSLGTGDVTLVATTSQLQFTRTDAHTVANKITGLGTVQIGGVGTGVIGSTNWDMTGTATQVVTFTGANNYTGATTIKNGTLVTGNTAALGAGNVVLNGGNLRVGNGTVQTVALASGKGITATAAATLAFSDATSAILLSVGGLYDFSGQTITLDLNNAFNSANTYNLISGGSSNVDAAGYVFTNFDSTNFSASFSNGSLIVTAVPEPSTYGLIGASALAAIGFVRRRRKVA